METIGDNSAVAVAARVARVRERIAAAAHRAGRDPGGIQLVAVSKRHPVAAVEAAIAAGVDAFGENYVQEAQAKIAALGPRPGTQWHLIGGLQANKARAAVECFDLVQTVDRSSLARRLGRIAIEEGRVLPVLVEVDLTGAEGRSGVAPAGLEALCAEIAAVPGLELRGLMGMAPPVAEAEGARPWFARLRSLFETLPDAHRRVLSMGMSGDYEVAVEEGATLVRVGTALFGARPIASPGKAG
ncbi:MAG: YggS family pyridoxal phosphate-dependent enzyme [Armatimonadota bacterium]